MSTLYRRHLDVCPTWMVWCGIEKGPCFCGFRMLVYSNTTMKSQENDYFSPMFFSFLVSNVPLASINHEGNQPNTMLYSRRMGHQWIMFFLSSLLHFSCFLCSGHILSSLFEWKKGHVRACTSVRPIHPILLSIHPLPKKTHHCPVVPPPVFPFPLFFLLFFSWFFFLCVLLLPNVKLPLKGKSLFSQPPETRYSGTFDSFLCVCVFSVLENKQKQ